MGSLVFSDNVKPKSGPPSQKRSSKKQEAGVHGYIWCLEVVLHLKDNEEMDDVLAIFFFWPLSPGCPA